MTLAEFKEQSEDFKKLRGNVDYLSGIWMVELMDRVVEAAYLAGLEQGGPLYISRRNAIPLDT